MAKHFKILSGVPALCLCVIKSMPEAQAFNGRLRYPAETGRRFNLETIQHGGHHINGVCILMPDLSSAFDPLWPVDNKWVADAAAIGFTFPAPERRVAGKSPSP